MNILKKVSNTVILSISIISVLGVSSIEVKAEDWYKGFFGVSIPDDPAEIIVKGSWGDDIDLRIYDNEEDYYLDNYREINTRGRVAKFGKGESGDFLIEVVCDDDIYCHNYDLRTTHSWSDFYHNAHGYSDYR